MENRHLCRGKRTDNGEWVEGFYFCMTHPNGRHTHHFIIPLGTDLSLGTPIEKYRSRWIRTPFAGVLDLRTRTES